MEKTIVFSICIICRTIRDARMHTKAQANIVENFAQSCRVYYAPVTNRQEPSMIYVFVQRANDLNRICNRASLFDRIKSRVVTRDCLKSLSLHLHTAAICVSCLCILPPVSNFSIFFLSFFTTAYPLEIANPRTRIRDRKLLDDAEIIRPKSHIRARTSVSNDTIPSDSPTRFLLTLFLGVCLKSRYRRLPLSAGFDPWLIKAQLMLARNDEDFYKAFLSLFSLSLFLFHSLSLFSYFFISFRCANQSHLKILEISATAE